VTFVDDVVEQQTADSPRRRLELIAAMTHHVEEALELAVADAYRLGLSTHTIAAILGIPRSSAYSRWRHLIPSENKRRRLRPRV
jgi:hypothetical protein